jgi:hypothetical protein
LTQKYSERIAREIKKYVYDFEFGKKKGFLFAEEFPENIL